MHEWITIALLLALSVLLVLLWVERMPCPPDDQSGRGSPSRNAGSIRDCCGS